MATASQMSLFNPFLIADYRLHHPPLDGMFDRSAAKTDSAADGSHGDDQFFDDLMEDDPQLHYELNVIHHHGSSPAVNDSIWQLNQYSTHSQQTPMVAALKQQQRQQRNSVMSSPMVVHPGHSQQPMLLSPFVTERKRHHHTSKQHIDQQPIEHELGSITKDHSEAAGANDVEGSDSVQQDNDYGNQSDIDRYWHEQNTASAYLSVDDAATAVDRIKCPILYDAESDSYPWMAQAVADGQQVSHTDVDDDEQYDAPSGISSTAMTPARPAQWKQRMQQQQAGDEENHAPAADLNNSIMWSVAKPVQPAASLRYEADLKTSQRAPDMLSHGFVSPIVQRHRSSANSSYRAGGHNELSTGNSPLSIPITPIVANKSAILHLSTSTASVALPLLAPSQPTSLHHTPIQPIKKLQRTVEELLFSPITLPPTTLSNVTVSTFPSVQIVDSQQQQCQRKVRFDLPADANLSESLNITPSTTTADTSVLYPRMTPSFTINDNRHMLQHAADLRGSVNLTKSQQSQLPPFELPNIGDFSVGCVSTASNTSVPLEEQELAAHATADNCQGDEQSYEEEDDVYSVHHPSIHHSTAAAFISSSSSGESVDSHNTSLQSLALLPSHNNTLTTINDSEGESDDSDDLTEHTYQSHNHYAYGPSPTGVEDGNASNTSADAEVMHIYSNDPSFLIHNHTVATRHNSVNQPPVGLRTMPHNSQQLPIPTMLRSSHRAVSAPPLFDYPPPLHPPTTSSGENSFRQLTFNNNQPATTTHAHTARSSPTLNYSYAHPLHGSEPEHYHFEEPKTPPRSRENSIKAAADVHSLAQAMHHVTATTVSSTATHPALQNSPFPQPIQLLSPMSPTPKIHRSSKVGKLILHSKQSSVATIEPDTRNATPLDTPLVMSKLSSAGLLPPRHQPPQHSVHTAVTQQQQQVSSLAASISSESEKQLTHRLNSLEEKLDQLLKHSSAASNAPSPTHRLIAATSASQVSTPAVQHHSMLYAAPALPQQHPQHMVHYDQHAQHLTPSPVVQAALPYSPHLQVQQHPPTMMAYSSATPAGYMCCQPMHSTGVAHASVPSTPYLQSHQLQPSAVNARLSYQSVLSSVPETTGEHSVSFHPASTTMSAPANIQTQSVTQLHGSPPAQSVPAVYQPVVQPAVVHHYSPSPPVSHVYTPTVSVSPHQHPHPQTVYYHAHAAPAPHGYHRSPAAAAVSSTLLSSPVFVHQPAQHHQHHQRYYSSPVATSYSMQYSHQRQVSSAQSTSYRHSPSPTSHYLTPTTLLGSPQYSPGSYASEALRRAALNLRISLAVATP